MPAEVKYGYLYGPRCMIKAWPIAASVVFTNTGGKFTLLDANDRIAIAVAGDLQLDGWVEVGAYTSSATAGLDTADVDVSYLSVFRVPANGSPANTRGETADLIVASNIQKVNQAASSTDVVKIMDLDTTDTTVDVMMNPTKMFTAGVA